MNYRLKKISGDASFREFYRLKKNNKTSIIVSAKKEKYKNLIVYSVVNKILNSNKITAPKLISNHYKNNKSAELRVDCGSSPVGSGGASFGSDLPQFASNIEFFHHLSSEFTIPLTNDKIRLLSISIEYPPQLS